MKYTTIQHEPRIKHGLTLMEYVFLDSVYKLQTSPKSIVAGWCYAKREYLADFLGVTKQTVLNLIESTIKKGFLIKDDTTRFLQVLPIWYDEFICFTDGKESLPEVKQVDGESKETLPPQGKETLPATYNNKNINNLINNAFSFSLKKQTAYANLSAEYKAKLKEEIEALRLPLAYQDFIDALEAKGYKYQNFLLAYKNWAKKSFNQGTRTTEYDGLVSDGKISKEVANTMSALGSMKWD